MLNSVQRTNKSQDSREKGSLGEKKRQNEQRRMVIRIVLLNKLGLYKVCKELQVSTNKTLTQLSCTPKEDGQSAQPNSSRNPPQFGD